MGRASVIEWFDEIRRRIVGYCGDPDADCLLTPSGTEAELIALAIASACWRRPISNIVLAPDETGRGIITAAGGAHFLGSAPFSDNIRKGARLAGWESADIQAVRVENRCADGTLRGVTEIDDEIEMRARAALAQGRGVLVHLLDVSKTGQSALSPETARRSLGLAPDRTFVLADCCQLRSSSSRLRDLADSGFIVAVTGSKFAGGPPFSGALIVPRGVLDRIDAAALPAGLGAHSARLDWPARIAEKIAPITTNEANLGLGLRWSAALAEMERFRSVSSALVAQAQARFLDETERGVAGIPGLRLLLPEASLAEYAATILPILLRHSGGAPLTQEEAAAVQRNLREIDGHDRFGRGRAFHVGQPVGVGSEVTLRVCLSMPAINEIADCAEAGMTIARALAPLISDLRDLFDKWASVWTTLGLGD
jgi:hypothetical protein